MFENYEQMSADEKAEVKRIHKSIRSQTSSRYGNLAWGFVRGFPYRRIERTTHIQTLGDGTVIRHNEPNPQFLTHTIASVISNFIESDPKRPWYNIKAHPDIVAWLKNPDGAIPAPAPRSKKPFVREEVA